MSNSYGQDGWGQAPQQGDQWGQNAAGPEQQAPYGQSPADPGVPQYGAYAQQGQPQYGAYAPQGQPQYGQNAQYGQDAQYGQNQQLQQGGLPAYQGQDTNPFAAPQAYGAAGGYGGGPVERPGMLSAACIILWVISGLALLGGIGIMAMEPSDLGLRSQDADLLQTVGVVVLVMAVLYTFLAVLVWKGSNVARIILTVLMGLSLLGSLAQLGQGGGGSIVGLILVILVLVCLWQRQSTAYMKYRAATKR